MKLISQYKNLPRQVYVLCSARIITAMGAFIFPFTSLLLTGVLNLSEITAGYMMIASALCSMLGAFICGKLADSFGRKKILVTILLIEIIALAVGGIVVYSYAVIPCMLLISASFSGALPIIAAMITDQTDESNRKESFSLMFFCINSGYALGQVFAGVLFYNYTRWIFWGQGILFIIATYIIIKYVQDIYILPDKIERDSSKEKDKVFNFLKVFLQQKSLVLFLVVITMITYCYIQVSYMLPLQNTATFGLLISSKCVSYVWILNGLFCVLLTPLLLQWTKKNNQIINVMIACVLYCIGFGGFGFIKETSDLWIIGFCTPVWTAGEVLVSTGSGVFIGSKAPEKYRARFQSLYELSSGIGRCIGPVTMGYFLVNHTYSQGWELVSFICLTAILLLILAYYQEKKQ